MLDERSEDNKNYLKNGKIFRNLSNLHIFALIHVFIIFFLLFLFPISDINDFIRILFIDPLYISFLQPLIPIFMFFFVYLIINSIKSSKTNNNNIKSVRSRIKDIIITIYLCYFVISPLFMSVYFISISFLIYSYLFACLIPILFYRKSNFRLSKTQLLISIIITSFIVSTPLSVNYINIKLGKSYQKIYDCDIDGFDSNKLQNVIESFDESEYFLNSTYYQSLARLFGFHLNSTELIDISNISLSLNQNYLKVYNSHLKFDYYVSATKISSIYSFVEPNNYIINYTKSYPYHDTIESYQNDTFSHNISYNLLEYNYSIGLRRYQFFFNDSDLIDGVMVKITTSYEYFCGWLCSLYWYNEEVFFIDKNYNIISAFFFVNHYAIS